MTSYRTIPDDLKSSTSSDVIDRTLKINGEIIDQLSIHGCKKCITIIQKIIRDNLEQNPEVRTSGDPLGQTSGNTENVHQYFPLKQRVEDDAKQEKRKFIFVERDDDFGPIGAVGP